MNELIRLLKSKHLKEVMLYGVIGVSGVLIDIVVFRLLTACFDWHYQLSNVISTMIGLTNNFFLNYYFNFKVYGNIVSRLIKYYFIGFIGLIVTVGLLYLLIEVALFDELYSKLISILLVTGLQYLFNKIYTFN